MISSQVGYAVQILLNIAESPNGRPLALQDSCTSVCSLSYAERIAGCLRKAGIVHARRGVGGGYTLARTLDAITYADVALAIDAHLQRRTDAITICFLEALSTKTLREVLEKERARRKKTLSRVL